jgi:hypothetical protein
LRAWGENALNTCRKFRDREAAKRNRKAGQCGVAADLAVLSILYRALRRLVGFVLTGEALRLRKIEQNTTAVCQYSEYLTLLNSFPDVKKSDEGASHEY